jgi:hypothetical protein
MNSAPSNLAERLAFFRGLGLPFDRAWQRSLYTSFGEGRVTLMRWGNGHDREEWVEAFEATRDEWERAYNGEASPLIHAIGILEADRDLSGTGVLPCAPALVAAA